ncbi:MAG TPA: hybrid sensor histidine kinase/response regulator [Geothrix sp.]|nr:hybrid sensor histidine kinase/response regulator [Geothrix sp.]
MEGEPQHYRRADHGARILVVDDEPLARRSVRAMLERGFYQVETASGGEEALALLPTYQPELVLLDIQMPDMDGLEVCRRIRDLPQGELLPIIFLTGDERPDVHAQALRAKGDDFLRKPVLSGELIVRIRSLMRLKRLQAEIQAERDNLLDLQQQREQLFQFIVHDLKNPLSAIQMGLELLDGGEEGRSASGNHLRRLRDTAQTMGRMIEDILDIGRAEQVGLDLRRTWIPLDTWIPRLVREVESQAQSRGHVLTWACPAGLELEADPAFLRRLLLNLVDNALKYSPAGSQTRIEARAQGGGVRLEVRDQGEGIPESMREQIFGKFVRLDEGGLDTRSGSGLGLAFCQLVAEAHGGRIWVEGNAPQGSVFVLEIPEAAATA